MARGAAVDAAAARRAIKPCSSSASVAANTSTGTIASNVRTGVRRISAAPITAPTIVGTDSKAANDRWAASSRRYAHADASEPGHIASALVALATGDGRPQAIAAGNDSSVPPPATAFTAPASAVAPNRSPSRTGCTPRCYSSRLISATH